MTDVFCTLVVPAALTPLARALAAGLSPRGSVMFLTPLSPTGNLPATHYVSTGYIDENVVALLGNGADLHAACVAAGAAVSLVQCNALVNNSDVSNSEPFAKFEELGLQMTQPEDS